jgi:hypothetical protein
MRMEQTLRGAKEKPFSPVEQHARHDRQEHDLYGRVEQAPRVDGHQGPDQRLGEEGGHDDGGKGGGGGHQDGQGDISAGDVSDDVARSASL